MLMPPPFLYDDGIDSTHLYNAAAERYAYARAIITRYARYTSR